MINKNNDIIQIKELKILAKPENEEVVCDFIENILEHYAVDFKFKFQLELVMREIFSHLIKYSNNSIKIRYVLVLNPLRLSISFQDKSEKFNPLVSVNDADGVDEMVVGGFSMYLIRNNIDNIYYNYTKDGVNVLTIEKLFIVSK